MPSKAELASLAVSIREDLTYIQGRVDMLLDALEAIRDYDAFQGGPIALRENPTTTAMRRIAAEALGS